MQAQERSQRRKRASLLFPQPRQQAADASASTAEGWPVPGPNLPRRASPISESGEPALGAPRGVHAARTTSSGNTSAEGASTTTSDPYMALVDEMIDKGSEFSLRGTDDELDMRSAVEASLGYEDLGAAEQDMRIRRRRLQSRRKWERVDSAQAYRLQEAHSQSLPTVDKSPVEALAEHPAEQQSLSSIYLATESAPASPFGSLQVTASARGASLLQDSGWEAGMGTRQEVGLPLLPRPPHAVNSMLSAQAKAHGLQGLRRSMSQQAIDRRMDSAQDVHPGQPGRPGIPRAVLSGFDRSLPVIYSAQPSEAADTPKALELPRSDLGPDEPGKGILGSPVASTGRGVGETPASIGSSSAPATLQLRTDKVTEGFRLGGTLTPRPGMAPTLSLQEMAPSSSSAPISGGVSSAFSNLLAQSTGTPAMPSRLIRQRDVSNDPMLKTVCESVQSALNMPYICVTALGNRRILTVALSSMPQEARMFGTGPFCSWLLEPCMPGLHSVPDCQADPTFKGHPAVVGTPSVRMFAAAPLVSATGHRLGALCVGSTEASELSPEHARLTTNFAKAVVRRLQALKFVQLDASEKAAMIEQCVSEQLATVLVNTATVDWHMLHANEAWRQLTGAELQTGVSTGLWESFEFISAEALDEPSSRQEAGADTGGCGGFLARGEAFSARVKRRPVGGGDGELMTLHFRPVQCPCQESPDSSSGGEAEGSQLESGAIFFTPFYTVTSAPATAGRGARSVQRSTCGCACAIM